MSDLQEEGKNAIIASMQPSCAELLPEDTLLGNALLSINQSASSYSPLLYNPKMDQLFDQLVIKAQELYANGWHFTVDR